MSFGYQTRYGWSQGNRKWRTETDTPLKVNPDWPDHKKIAFKFERHTLLCKHCSMFALKNKHQTSAMCAKGAQVAAKYHAARTLWMHTHPVAFAQSVVGAVLRGQDEKRKKISQKKFTEEFPPNPAG